MRQNGGQRRGIHSLPGLIGLHDLQRLRVNQLGSTVVRCSDEVAPAQTGKQRSGMQSVTYEQRTGFRSRPSCECLQPAAACPSSEDMRIEMWTAGGHLGIEDTHSAIFIGSEDRGIQRAKQRLMDLAIGLPSLLDLHLWHREVQLSR